MADTRQQSRADPARAHASGDDAARVVRKAEETREAIKELAEAPPVKTMAEVKAASELLEAAARDGVHSAARRAQKGSR